MVENRGSTSSRWLAKLEGEEPRYLEIKPSYEGSSESSSGSASASAMGFDREVAKVNLS
jgi:hypothetical protein